MLSSNRDCVISCNDQTRKDRFQATVCTRKSSSGPVTVFLRFRRAKQAKSREIHSGPKPKATTIHSCMISRHIAPRTSERSRGACSRSRVCTCHLSFHRGHPGARYLKCTSCTPLTNPKLVGVLMAGYAVCPLAPVVRGPRSGDHKSVLDNQLQAKTDCHVFHQAGHQGPMHRRRRQEQSSALSCWVTAGTGR